MLIRTHSAPTQFMNAIASVISSVDPHLVATSSTLEQMLHMTTRFATSSLAAAIASAAASSAFCLHP
jgi:hypothetical protein